MHFAATVTSKLVFDCIKSECIPAELQFYVGNEPKRRLKILVKSTQLVLIVTMCEVKLRTIIYTQKFLHSDWQRALIPKSAKTLNFFECRKTKSAQKVEI